MVKKTILAMLFLAFLLTMFGCPPPPPQHYGPRPAPKKAYRSRPPHNSYIWVDGHWTWRQGRWVWSNGYWMKPRPGYQWVPGHYERQGNRDVWIPGHWRRIR